MGKSLTEDIKKKISDFYQNGDMSLNAIADNLGVSVSSVRRYKNYEHREVEQNDGNCGIDTTQKMVKLLEVEGNETIEQKEDIPEKIVKKNEVSCPECNAPESELLTIKEALDLKLIQIKENTRWAWDFYCRKCNELISLKKCPDCSADISHFIPIRKTNVSDELKQKYNFVCRKCRRLINVNDFSL